MRSPNQIWALFGTCIALAVIGMSWLTVKTLQLDRAEAIARAQAVQEEAIGRALWRMDVSVTPWLAEEAARPSQFFNNESPLSLVNHDADERSNLFAKLHFQIDPSGVFTSPQCRPPEASSQQSKIASADRSTNDDVKNLGLLQSKIQFDQLLASATVERAITERMEVLLQNELAQAFGNNTIQTTNEAFTQQLNFPSQNAGLPQQQIAQQASINDLSNRNLNLQSSVRKEAGRQGNLASVVPMEQIGVFKTTWVDSELFLLRRVDSNRGVRIQGCWLDWPKIQDSLQQEIADILPSCSLDRVLEPSGAQPGRVLATLPIQLSVPPSEIVSPRYSSLRLALLTAWSSLVLTAVAFTFMLRGVMALSERRAAFVSAVTHELRTPLTTFRMYAEMLADGMVRDENQRRAYLSTLQVEADRLSHMVENVLQYAKLEKSVRLKRLEAIPIDSLFRGMEARLREHCTRANFELHSLANNERSIIVHTDPMAVEQIVFNLVDNACKYGASLSDRRIEIRTTHDTKFCQIHVRDYGQGISVESARKLFRPFSKTDEEAATSAPGIGLGLALCKRMATQLGGSLWLETPTGQGAEFVLRLPLVPARSASE